MTWDFCIFLGEIMLRAWHHEGKDDFSLTDPYTVQTHVTQSYKNFVLTHLILTTAIQNTVVLLILHLCKPKSREVELPKNHKVSSKDFRIQTQVGCLQGLPRAPRGYIQYLGSLLRRKNHDDFLPSWAVASSVIIATSSLVCFTLDCRVEKL